MKALYNILLYIWQLPQNILGLILILIYKPYIKLTLDNGNLVYFTKNLIGGISLGKYSIIGGILKDIEYINPLSITAIRHESLGHGTQSKMLGPFYLIIIGLPSIIWAFIYGRYIPRTKNGYYKFYTEKWADKLGNIIR